MKRSQISVVQWRFQSPHMNPTKILWQDLKPSAEKLSFYTAVQKRVRVLSQFSKTEICLSFFQPEVKLVNFWLPPKVKKRKLHLKFLFQFHWKMLHLANLFMEKKTINTFFFNITSLQWKISSHVDYQQHPHQYLIHHLRCKSLTVYTCKDKPHCLFTPVVSIHANVSEKINTDYLSQFCSVGYICCL